MSIYTTAETSTTSSAEKNVRQIKPTQIESIKFPYETQWTDSFAVGSMRCRVFFYLNDRNPRIRERHTGIYEYDLKNKMISCRYDTSNVSNGDIVFGSAIMKHKFYGCVVNRSAVLVFDLWENALSYITNGVIGHPHDICTDIKRNRLYMLTNVTLQLKNSIVQIIDLDKGIANTSDVLPAEICGKNIAFDSATDTLYTSGKSSVYGFKIVNTDKDHEQPNNSNMIFDSGANLSITAAHERYCYCATYRDGFVSEFFAKKSRTNTLIAFGQCLWNSLMFNGCCSSYSSSALKQFKMKNNELVEFALFNAKTYKLTHFQLAAALPNFDNSITQIDTILSDPNFIIMSNWKANRLIMLNLPTLLNNER